MTTSDLQLLKALILTAPFASLADPVVQADLVAARALP